MNKINNIKPFTIGKQQYRLNESPTPLGTVVIPLVDKEYQFDAVLNDILIDCSKLALLQTYCCFTPRRVIAQIGGVRINDVLPLQDIKDRIMRKFPMIKNHSFDVNKFRRKNTIHNLEAIITDIRHHISIQDNRRFESLMNKIFEDISELYSEYTDRYILIPLDYIKVPLQKGKLVPSLYRSESTSLATLLLLYMKINPTEFIKNMKRSKADIVFYSDNGVFKLSHDSIETTVVNLKAENETQEKLIGELTLYGEAQMIKEDKLVDVTLVGIKKLRGEGFLVEDVPSEEDEILDNIEISEEELKAEAEIEKLFDSNIGVDETKDANSKTKLRSPSTEYSKEDQIIIAKLEDGTMDKIRVVETKITKQKAENIKNQKKSQMINDIATEGASEKEIEVVEELVDAVVDIDPDMKKIVESVKQLKDIQLSRTKVYNAKEKKYLQRIEADIAELEIANLEELKLEETVYSDVESFDNIAENKFMNFNKVYNEKLREKDLVSNIAHFSTVDDFPLYYQGIEVKDISDKFNNREDIKVQFKDMEGNAQTIHLERPKLDGNKMYINGTFMELQTQRILKPIVKFDEHVMLSFVYNKAFIELSGKYISRQESRLARFTNKVLGEPELKGKIKYINFGTVVESDGIEKTVEFVRIGRMIESIYKDENNFLYFSNAKCKEAFGDDFNSPEYMKVGKKNGSVITLDKSNDTLSGYPVGSFVSLMIGELEDDIIMDTLYSINPKSTLAHSIMKIMSRKLPIALILAYTEGLDVLLERSKVNYEIIYSDKKPKIEDVMGEELLVFKDCYVKYSIRELEHGILFAGLQQFDLSEYTYADFCDTTKGIAADIISTIGNGNLPLYVSNFKMLFIDPISIDVLKHYNLPTTFIDVLLYSNSLLTTDIIMSDKDTRLYRYRNAEIIEAVTYKVIADAYSNYSIAKKRGAKNARLEIPKDAVIRAMFELGNVQTYSTVNPIVSAMSKTKVTVKGPSGLNLDRGITLEKRIIDPSTAGVIAMPSVYTGGIGIVQQTPIDANIVSARGYLNICDNKEEIRELSAKQMLSPSELITPGTTSGDEAQRVKINYMQKGHVQGLAKPTLASVSNGYDELIGHHAKEFAHYMEKDGIIKAITEDFIFVTYNDGTEDVFRIDQVERHSAKAKYLDNKMKMMSYVKVGKKLKANEALAYNEGMFVEYEGRPIYCTGTVMNLLLMSVPEAYEDATLISETATEKLASYVNKNKVITIDKSTIIKSAKTNLYEKVKANDILLSHAIMSSDEALNSLLGDNPDEIDSSLTKEKTAGVSGEIKSINVYYCCQKSELSSSLQRYIKKLEDMYAERGDSKIDELNVDTFKAHYNNRMPVRVPEGMKVANKKIYKDEVVIEYIIRSYSKVSDSDKVTYFNALKGETSKVLPDNMMPVGVTTGIKIDCIMSPLSPAKRKVMSLIKMGATERLIYELMNGAKAMNDYKKAKDFIVKGLVVAEGGNMKTALNAQKYKEQFDGMNDNEFKKFLDTGILRVKVIPLEYDFEFANVKKAMEEVVGKPLAERVTLPLLFNDPELGAMISEKKQMILRLPVLKLMQTAQGENRYVGNISKRDKSNQVVNSSKGASISDREVAMLQSGGYEKVIEELFTFRADNDIAKKEAYTNIALTGRTNIPEAPVEGKVALKYITACYIGMGIDPGFIKDDE